MSQEPHASGTPSSGGMGGADQPWQRADGLSSPAPAPDPESAWAETGYLFAGILLLVDGVLAILQGIAAIAGDDVYSSIGSYVYELHLTGWGWVHLIVGVLAALTGVGLLRGVGLARHVGMFFASLGIVVQFLFLPYAPFWSVLMIAMNVFVLWALAAYHPKHGRKATAG
ncbi:hypothetical protein [Streptomyces sp. NPDC020681]|uniref:DUF7144 family membrane protein n=1 Tax=Streptomyces sp. NPDC020681 TaxID=3365083 RepID=UPI003795C24D